MHRENDKIERYKTYLRLEKALSANSIDAYLTDLDKLTNFVESEGKKYADVTYDDLQQFVARLHDIGIHPRSQARIISGIKSFYRFLFLDDYITTDPTELLESPKIGLKLPEVLTVNEINSILDTIDLTLPEGQRNRAMLEVLYSCGLRVSELVSLRFTDVYFDEGFIKVEGKGSKQRLVPISETAIKEIKNYLYDRNHVAVKKGFEDILFLSRARNGSVADHGFSYHQAANRNGRYQKEREPAYVPPFLRHPPVGRGSQLACYPGDAGT